MCGNTAEALRPLHSCSVECVYYDRAQGRVLSQQQDVLQQMPAQLPRLKMLLPAGPQRMQLILVFPTVGSDFCFLPCEQSSDSLLLFLVSRSCTLHQSQRLISSVRNSRKVLETKFTTHQCTTQTFQCSLQGRNVWRLFLPLNPPTSCSPHPEGYHSS